MAKFEVTFGLVVTKKAFLCVLASSKDFESKKSINYEQDYREIRRAGVKRRNTTTIC